MFNGLITHRGMIVFVEQTAAKKSLEVQVEDPLFWSDVCVGDSIAVMGCCLTVVALKENSALFDVSQETLRCTTFDQTKIGDKVHVEKALRFGDRLQGHLLLGHVSGVGKVIKREFEGDSLQLWVSVDPTLMKMIASKGSIAINGVSLTINGVESNTFWVNLIPHTLQKTELGALMPGSRVNVEIDPLARYVERLIAGANHGF